MSDVPDFQQIFSSPLYAMPAEANAPGWVGFIWTGGEPYPPSASLAVSFMSGHYLFAPTAPALPDNTAAIAYAANIVTWLNGQFGVPPFNQFRGCACLWLADPSQAAANTPAIAFQQLGATATVNAFNVSVGQLTFSIPGQTILSMGSRGLSFSTVGSGRPQFNLTDNTTPPSLPGGASLPFVGAYAGAFVLSGALTRSGQQNTLDGMGSGLRYVYGQTGQVQAQTYPVLQTSPLPNVLPDIPYAGAFDPLDPLNSVTPLSAPAAGRFRTLFALAASQGTPPRLASWQSTPTGGALDLLPLHGAAPDAEPPPWAGALVLQSTTPSSAPQPGAIYLAPAGDFALAPSGGGQDGTEVELLPGLAGAERIRLTAWSAAPDAGFDHLRFAPSHPAYAPVFPFPAASLDTPEASRPRPRLASDYQTAWVAVLSGANAPPTYLAQPQGDPLYAPTPGTSDTVTPLLPPLDTPSAIPQTGPDQGLTLLPTAPYAGLDVTPGFDLAGFESQILSAERKAILGRASVVRGVALRNARAGRLAASVIAPTRPATTPQGLYAEIEPPSDGSPDALYKKVILANSTAKSPATGSVPFGFENLAPELQDLFQTNQLMAVIVNPAKLGTPSRTSETDAPVFDRDAIIADWRMTAAVGDSLNATAYSNILILKYCDGALRDRVQNPSKWVNPTTFSVPAGQDPAVSLTGLSSYLQTYIDNGIAAADGGDTLYADFKRIVTDPNWQGFIVLGAKVDPSGFPDQVKGLIAGIDFSQFQAHHFGATTSRVSVTGQTVTLQTPSSLFGLIDYQLPAYRANVAAGGSLDMPLPLASGADFGFQVLQLQALFRNAALVDFRSRVQLTINQLFLSPVSSAYGAIGRLPAQGVVLDGSYQRQGDTAVYVFEQNAVTRFMLSSNVLPSVALERVTFNTLSTGTDGTVRSRFLMNGALEFAVLSATVAGVTSDADLLSFGPPPGASPLDPPRGLSFSGLDVTMSSPVDSPNAVTFVFEASKLALDQGSSQPRPNSLFTDLALQVDGFIAGAEDKRAINYGFLPVSVEPKVKGLSGPWFGVAYKVTMGGPGGLVAQAGFTSRILLAWGPGSTDRDATAAVFTGLQLPGASPGAKLFSIQGVLKLTIDSLTLRREQVSGATPAFTLRLNNLGLTFLGIVKIPTDPINFFLFGDPSGDGALGWYAAYVAKTPPASPPIPPLPPAPPARLEQYDEDPVP